MDSFVAFLEQHGSLGLFIHSFIDAIFFPVPAFFTQVSLSLINPSSALMLATVGYIACILGTPVGYVIGRGAGTLVMNKLLKKEWVDKASSMFERNGEAAILIGAFTPIPFKVFTILSGALAFPLWKLIVYAAIGRAAKFYVVGFLFYWFGRAAEGMVHQVSFYMFVIVVPILVVGLLIKRRRDNKRRQAEANPPPEDPLHKVEQRIGE